MAKRSKKRKEIGKGISTKIAVSPESPSPFRRDWILGLILVLAVVLAYSPVWWAGFVWDDVFDLTENTSIVGPHGLKEIWATSAAQFYPLVLTTFWAEHALWGLAPLPYHLVNVFMHGACAILLWRVLLLLQIPGAWLGAALWALHPVQVESVAWIAEMKNTESGVFFLLTILFFVKGLKEREVVGRAGGKWDYGLTLLFAALAMACKSSTVILPLVLALFAWWVEGQLKWRDLARIAPILLMSAADSALTLWTVTLQGVTSNSPWALSGPERLIVAGNAFWFYLGKLLWPHPLISFYPRWQIDAGQGVEYLPLLAAIVFVIILWLKRGTWSRPYFFSLGYFLAALLPVLGLVNHFILQYSYVFDHFQYLASMGPLALIGAGLARFVDWAIPGKLRLQSTLGAGLLLILGLISWQRAWAFESQETLWTDTLAKNPNSWAAQNNLGYAFFQNGREDEAIVQYQKALAINPGYAEAYYNLGDLLLNEKRFDEAAVQYQRALAITPDYAQAHNNLGDVLSYKGNPDEAMVQFQKALEINPDYAEAHYNLGTVLVQKGLIDKGMVELQEALRLKPDYVNAEINLARAQAMAQQRANQK